MTGLGKMFGFDSEFSSEVQGTLDGTRKLTSDEVLIQMRPHRSGVTGCPLSQPLT